MFECPICEFAAEDITEHTFGGVSVACPQCGTYDVSGTAVAVLPHLEGSERMSALTKAQESATSSDRPIIQMSEINRPAQGRDRNSGFM